MEGNDTYTNHGDEQRTAAEIAALLDEDILELESHNREYASVIRQKEIMEAEIKARRERLAARMLEEGASHGEEMSTVYHRYKLMQAETGNYDPDAFPSWVYEIPGVVVRTVDKKKLEALIKAGVIDPDTARAAWKGRKNKPYLRVELNEDAPKLGDLLTRS